MTNNPKRRFSETELEVACIEAHTSGRIYSEGGEKRTPFDEHTAMLDRAKKAALTHRKRMRKENHRAL